MDKLTTLKLFITIVEQGSFTQAGRVLNLPKASATYAIQALESRLGSRLLERTTRKVFPTQEGLHFYQRCKKIVDELDEAEREVSNQHIRPNGLLRLDLHETHATQIILPKLPEFHEKYPLIQLQISSSDRLVNLLDEQIDCVVRAGIPQDSSLVAHRLAEMPEVICASPAYLTRYGIPTTPQALKNHQGVIFFSTTSTHKYPFELIINKQLVKFDCQGWMAVDNAECYLAAALAGCGLIQLPYFHVKSQIEAGLLCPVLSQYHCPTRPISAYYPYHQQKSPRVKAFITWLDQLYQRVFPR